MVDSGVFGNIKALEGMGKHLGRVSDSGTWYVSVTHACGIIVALARVLCIFWCGRTWFIHYRTGSEDWERFETD